jgi:hypothetical protein
MKKLGLLFAFFLVAGLVTAQTEESQEVEVAKAELPEAAAKGAEISELAKSLEGGKEKGKTISSAARKSTVQNEQGAKGPGNATKGIEASEAGKARSQRPANVGASAPNPNAPAVRPNAAPANKPVTPAGGRPGGI